jgi:superfamily II DNA/RNA helicase
LARLLDLARRVEAAGADAKAEALLSALYRLQQEESEPDLKLRVFTEFLPTQEMLRDFLSARGYSVVTLNGTMDFEARRRVQESFAGPARVLVSTDAGGEGLNLQSCHVVVNYDLPWNPMRIEQRIGRVDRIGQARQEPPRLGERQTKEFLLRHVFGSRRTRSAIRPTCSPSSCAAITTGGDSHRRWTRG